METTAATVEATCAAAVKAEAWQAWQAALAAVGLVVLGLMAGRQWGAWRQAKAAGDTDDGHASALAVVAVAAKAEAEAEAAVQRERLVQQLQEANECRRRLQARHHY